jgi:hypothetical protein
MPGKPVPHAIRFPDYGVPFKVIAYGSYAQMLIYYAHFKKGPFTYADHMSMRFRQIRKDMWVIAAKKLVGLGWMNEVSDGVYQITKEGSDAVRRIGNRNAIRRAKVGDSKDA